MVDDAQLIAPTVACELVYRRHHTKDLLDFGEQTLRLCSSEPRIQARIRFPQLPVGLRWPVVSHRSLQRKMRCEAR